MSRRRYDILGVPVDALDTAGVLGAIESLLRDGRPHQVATVNPEFVMKARVHPKFRRALEESDLAFVDGVGVALAIRLIYGAAATRVGGVDILPDLARICAANGWPVFLLGAAPGVAEVAAERLKAAAPDLGIAGTYSGSPAREEEEYIAEMVQESDARLLLVAFGAPAQDLWIARNLVRLGPVVAIGVGGSFDYLAGRMPRAPEWVRRLGLEWLYRLVRQPWRWRRQLVLPVFALLVLGEALRRRVSVTER